MKRKVVQIAGFTKVISLPSGWVRRLNIKKGEELDVIEGDHALTISTAKQRTFRKATIDTSNLSPVMLWPTLALLHKTGYEEVKITPINHEMLSIIHERVQSSLFGFEVIEQTDKYCLIRNLAEGSPANLESLMRKVFLVTLSEARQSLQFIKKTEFESLKEVVKLEETNNKLTNFSQRLLNEESMTLNNRYHYFIVWLLENVGDGYRDLCKAVLEYKNMTLSPDVIKVYDDVNKLFEDFYDLYYKFELEKMSSFIQNIKKVNNKIVSLLVKKDGLNALVLSHLLYLDRTFYDFVGASLYLKADLEQNMEIQN